MQLIQNNPALFELSAYIGEGWQSPTGDCVLRMGERGGDGVLWPLIIGNERQWLWCSEHSWCEWVAPVLSISHLSEVPAEIFPLVNQWGGLPISGFIDDVSWELPVLGGVAMLWDPVLTVKTAERELTCRLVGWPIALVRQLTHNWVSIQNTQAQIEPLFWTASLQIGRLDCCLRRLKQWQIGDGICIQQVAQLEKGQLWLAIAGKRILIEQQEPGGFIVQEVVNENDFPIEDNSDDAASLEEISFPLSIEVGRIMLPLSTLTSLNVGDCLSGQTQLGEGVRLLLQGQCIGKGSLLQIGEQWVVRISELNNHTSAK